MDKSAIYNETYPGMSCDAEGLENRSELLLGDLENQEKLYYFTFFLLSLSGSKFTEVSLEIFFMIYPNVTRRCGSTDKFFFSLFHFNTFDLKFV